jgi:hypothetical protein
MRITTFATTLLDDETAFSARETLGLSSSSDVVFNSLNLRGPLSATVINGSFNGDIILNVINETESTIPAGSVVYNKSTNEDGLISIDLAKSNLSIEMPAIGITLSDIESGQTSSVLTYGIANVLDTRFYSLNDAIYVGQFGSTTNVRPNSLEASVQKIGNVLSLAQNGLVLFSFFQGEEESSNNDINLDDLRDELNISSVNNSIVYAVALG